MTDTDRARATLTARVIPPPGEAWWHPDAEIIIDADADGPEIDDAIETLAGALRDTPMMLAAAAEPDGLTVTAVGLDPEAIDCQEMR